MAVRGSSIRGTISSPVEKARSLELEIPDGCERGMSAGWYDLGSLARSRSATRAQSRRRDAAVRTLSYL